MTRSAFDRTTEVAYVSQYLASLPPGHSTRERALLLRARSAFDSVGLGQSWLAHAASTEWALAWRKAIPSKFVAIPAINAVGRWWSWLFERTVIDDNVLACFHPHAQALREPPVVLGHNLQRPIALYLDSRGPRQRETRQRLSRRLQKLNLFLHRLLPPWDGETIGEAVVIDWLRSFGGTNWYLGLVAGTARHFFEYLVDNGRLRTNPFKALEQRYGRQRLFVILAKEVGRPGIEVPLAARKPTFQSRLASQLEAFVSLRRAMGLHYRGRTLGELQRFDRFVAALADPPDIVTGKLVESWMEQSAHLRATTRKKRLGLVRQFSLYLARLRPDTHIPSRSRFPIEAPVFKAYIYSPDEYRDLLQAALSLPGPHARLRAKTFHAVLLVLFGTGLRIGEALRLRLRDVDLEAGTLLIRQTKFMKSRIVPISPSLVDALRLFLKERLEAAAGPDAPLFISHWRQSYSVDSFSKTFHKLLVVAGVPRVPRARRPRVYDIRHTFAVTRVLQWYQEGADLQAKLPLLATYMGHVDVLSTQVYLHSTPELLQAGNQRFERAFGSLVTSPAEVSHEAR